MSAPVLRERSDVPAAPLYNRITVSYIIRAKNVKENVELIGQLTRNLIPTLARAKAISTRTPPVQNVVHAAEMVSQRCPTSADRDARAARRHWPPRLGRERLGSAAASNNLVE
jgi:hypothetical protein